MYQNSVLWQSLYNMRNEKKEIEEYVRFQARNTASKHKREERERNDNLKRWVYCGFFLFLHNKPKFSESGGQLL